MIQCTQNGQVLTVTVFGEVDHHSASALRKEIDAEIGRTQPKTLILDFHEVGFCDSSGIAVVLGRYKLMRGLGGEVRLQNLPAPVRKIFELADVGKLIQID